jgi:hypothetical protein
MVRSFAIVAAALGGILSGSPARAQPGGVYHFRNDSETPLSCRLRVARGDLFTRFALRPGRDIRLRLENQRSERVLICSSSVYRRFTFQVKAGWHYALIETRSGELRLRTLSQR